ncbi:MAG: ABC transporter permease [Ignavibacteriales bacterium]
MISNYLKIFYRTLLRHKTSSVINIAGLALAITSCVFIVLFVFDELKYDQFNKNKDRIYRLVQQSKQTGEKNVIMEACNFSLLYDEVPEFESGFRLFRNFKQVVAIRQQKFIDDVYYADKEILNIFTFPLIKGDIKTALEAPFSILITEELSKKYFGNADAVGKTLTLENQYDFKITGILKNIPWNSHLRPSIIASISTLNTTQPYTMNSTNVASCFIYMLLKPGASKDRAEVKLNNNLEIKYGKDWIKYNRMLLQPLQDIYLYPTGSPWDYAEHGDMTLVKSFMIIALLILLMASFNYSNILTTFTKIREKELACRKLLGAGRWEIIKQFVLETVLYLLISLAASVILTAVFMKGFNQLTGKNVKITALASPEIIVSILFLLILTALLSVIYPAFISFRTDPLNRAKGNTHLSHNNYSRYISGFRYLVTGLQFVITIGLIIAVSIIYSQMQYVSSSKLGFNKEHLISIDNPYGIKMHDNFDNFRNKIMQFPQVLSVSASENIPSENICNFTFVYPNGRSYKETIKSGQIAADYDLLKTWQAKLLSGRDFSRGIASDKDHAIIITRAAAEAMNLKDPVGCEIKGVNNSSGNQQIIGVVEDIHFKSFKEKVLPIIFYLRPWCAANIMVRLRGNDITSAINRLEREWKKIMPDRPFIYNFVDESYDKLYKTEKRTGSLLLIFCTLAIIISSFGLFNLISLIAQTRKKEIGIRKVLGASVSNVVVMITREFIIIILAANIIAWPVAYFAMNSWLQDFAYRITLSPWPFIFSALITLFIAIVTLSYQALKAAITNPVQSIKYE